MTHYTDAHGDVIYTAVSHTHYSPNPWLGLVIFAALMLVLVGVPFLIAGREG